MRYLMVLLILLLSVSVTAGDILYSSSDTLGYEDAIAVTYDSHGVFLASGISDGLMLTSSNAGLGFWGTPRETKKDTLKWYVVEVGEVCDSLFSERWIKAGEFEGQDYFKRGTIIDSVVCGPDTAWAEKVLFYFTPDEVAKLREVFTN